VAADHVHAVGAGGALELGEQAGLSDAGLAGHERERGLAGDGLTECGTQLVQLRGASDEGRAADAGSHATRIARAAAGTRGLASGGGDDGRGHAADGGAGASCAHRADGAHMRYAVAYTWPRSPLWRRTARGARRSTVTRSRATKAGRRRW